MNGSKSSGWHVTRVSMDIKKENLIFWNSLKHCAVLLERHMRLSHGAPLRYAQHASWFFKGRVHQTPNSRISKLSNSPNSEKTEQLILNEHAEQFVLSEQSGHRESRIPHFKRTSLTLEILKIYEQGEQPWVLHDNENLFELSLTLFNDVEFLKKLLFLCLDIYGYIKWSKCFKNQLKDEFGFCKIKKLIFCFLNFWLIPWSANRPVLHPFTYFIIFWPSSLLFNRDRKKG